MKSLALFLSVGLFSISSAHAGNCKAINDTGIPGLTPGLSKILSDHGYIMSSDEDSQYAVLGTNDYDENSSQIKTEIKLFMDKSTEVASGVGTSHVPMLFLALQVCGEEFRKKSGSLPLTQKI